MKIAPDNFKLGDYQSFLFIILGLGRVVLVC